MSFALIALAVALALATAMWLSRRPQTWLMPSDAYFILFFLTAAVVPFINLRAESDFAISYPFSNQTIATSLNCLTISCLAFALVWFFRKPIVMPDFQGRPDYLNEGAARAANRRTASLLRSSTFLLVAMIAISLLFPNYFSYKLRVFEFITGQIDSDEYQLVRRVLFAGDFIVAEVIGRLRFSLLPVLFVAATILSIRKFGVAWSMPLMALLFTLGPASMSKFPIFIYVGYFAISALMLKRFQWPFKFRNALTVVAILLPLLIVLLTSIYYLQYADSLHGLESLPSVISLSYFRVFVANYNGLLQYITVFRSGDVGVEGSVIAPIFGLETRNLDQEVAIWFLGPVRGLLTTFPTVYVGNAFATFGYLGVAVFSAAVAGILWAIDVIYSKIRQRELRIIYYSTMIINTTFFSIMAAPTALTTYGCAIIPVLVYVSDYYLARGGRGSVAGRRRPFVRGPVYPSRKSVIR